MSATRLNDAVNALLAAYQAAAALAGVPVYDGVQATASADNDFIVVGHDGSLGADGSLAADALAGSFTQVNLEFGARQETGYIGCLIVSQTGDATDFAGRRQRATDLLAAAEDAALANGGYQAPDFPGLLFDGTSDGRLINRLSQGTAVLLADRVYYSTEWD